MSLSTDHSDSGTEAVHANSGTEVVNADRGTETVHAEVVFKSKPPKYFGKRKKMQGVNILHLQGCI